LQVNVSTFNQQRVPDVAVDADGDFVVAWQSDDDRGLNDGVYARRFDADGVPQTGEFRVNTFTAGFQGRAALAMDADGDFVAAWQSNNQDGSSYGIYAQRYGPNQRPTTLGIPAVIVQQDEADTVLQLRDSFDDPNTADDTLTFSVVGSTNPQLFSGTPINNGTGTLTLDYATGRSGQATLTVRATDPGGLFVDTSFNVTVIPTEDFEVTATEFVYQSPPHRLRVTFSRDVSVASLTADDLTFVMDGPQDPPEFIASAVTYDAATRTATFTLPPTGQQFLANGNYRATLAAGAVNDVSGTPLAAASVTNFFVLIGDINRDRSVNGTDFAILAGNFGKQGMSYAQGDLNGDGSVNGSDFALLAGNFGRNIPAPAAAVTTALAPRPRPRRVVPARAAAKARRSPLLVAAARSRK